MRIAKYAQPMSIGEAARATGYSIQMLRVLDKTGVVQPVRFGANQARVYLAEHIEAIKQYRAQRGRKK
jgi:DNA-binding transcriptional MerR regulator